MKAIENVFTKLAKKDKEAVKTMLQEIGYEELLARQKQQSEEKSEQRLKNTITNEKATFLQAEKQASREKYELQKQGTKDEVKSKAIAEKLEESQQRMEAAITASTGAADNMQKAQEQMAQDFTKNLHSILVHQGKLKHTLNKDALAWCKADPQRIEKLLAALNGDIPALASLSADEKQGFAKKDWFKPDSAQLDFLEFALKSPQAFKLLNNAENINTQKNIEKRMRYYVQCAELAQKIVDTRPVGYDKLPEDKKPKALNDWREKEQLEIGRVMITLTANAPGLFAVAKSSPDKFIAAIQNNFSMQQYLTAIQKAEPNVAALAQPCLDNPALFLQAKAAYIKEHGYADDAAFYKKLTKNNEVRGAFLEYINDAQAWSKSAETYLQLNTQQADRLLSFWLTYGGTNILTSEQLFVTQTMIDVSADSEKSHLFNNIIERAAVAGSDVQQLAVWAKYAQTLSSLGITVHNEDVLKPLVEELKNIKGPQSKEAIQETIGSIITSNDEIKAAVKAGMNYGLTLKEMGGILQSSSPLVQYAVESVVMEKLAKECDIKYQKNKPEYESDGVKIAELTKQLTPHNIEIMRTALITHKRGMDEEVIAGEGLVNKDGAKSHAQHEERRRASLQKQELNK